MKFAQNMVEKSINDNRVDSFIWHLGVLKTDYLAKIIIKLKFESFLVFYLLPLEEVQS